MHEVELGGPFYRQPEAVAVDGDFRRWLRWRSARSGVIRESSAVVGVYWVRLDANRTWIRSLGQALVGTGRRGSVGGRERVQCCRATATVQRGCAGVHEATRRARERWAARNGVEPPFLSPVGCNGVSAAARHAGVGGQGATDAGKMPSARAGVLAREKKARATRQAHCGRVTETDGRKRH